MHIYTLRSENPKMSDVLLAGCTLEDFEANFKLDLHPRMIRWCGLIHGLPQAIFLSHKSSVMWCHYEYLTAPD